MEMDYTQYNNIIKIKTFDIFPPKNVLRKRKIENLLDFFDKTTK